uniref:(northern house mosquito) hypothetical protein n=1 Tax=Culex pipiens TaxID=7175 RepID=A0A8D8L7E8_CULPI
MTISRISLPAVDPTLIGGYSLANHTLNRIKRRGNFASFVLLQAFTPPTAFHFSVRFIRSAAQPNQSCALCLVEAIFYLKLSGCCCCFLLTRHLPVPSDLVMGFYSRSHKIHPIWRSKKRAPRANRRFQLADDDDRPH